jgi:DNA repair protein RadB
MEENKVEKVGNRIMLPEPLYSLIGGIEKGALTNFYGAPGVGKTNICFLAVLECLKVKGRVIYIDTEGGFSLERLKQLTPDADSVLKKVVLLEPKTFVEQGKMIRSLGKENADMIIVDSMVALYRLECADPERETLEANKELSKQLSVLSNMAREKNIPVLVTSHTYKNWDTGENHIIGGDTIKYWSKSIVFFEHTGKMSERKATVVKHRSIPEGGSVKFMIVEDGIKPSGFKLF